MFRKEAIILVAGMGTRLKPLTLENHKCLTKVNGKEIIFNALDNLKEAGVSHVWLVVGYLAEAVKNTIGSNYKGLEISYVENSIYDKTNTSYSLKLGLESLLEYDELYVLEGDVFFSKGIFDKLKENEHIDATLLEPYREDLDGSFVELNTEGYVVDWTHKSMREDNYVVENKYKTINIHKFSRKFVEERLKPWVHRVCDLGNQRNPLENVMREIVRVDNKAVFGVLSDGEKWYEIDDLNDLKTAERIFGEE